MAGGCERCAGGQHHRVARGEPRGAGDGLRGLGVEAGVGRDAGLLDVGEREGGPAAVVAGDGAQPLLQSGDGRAGPAAGGGREPARLRAGCGRCRRPVRRRERRRPSGSWRRPASGLMRRAVRGGAVVPRSRPLRRYVRKVVRSWMLSGAGCQALAGGGGRPGPDDWVPLSSATGHAVAVDGRRAALRAIAAPATSARAPRPIRPTCPAGKPPSEPLPLPPPGSSDCRRLRRRGVLGDRPAVRQAEVREGGAERRVVGVHAVPDVVRLALELAGRRPAARCRRRRR